MTKAESMSASALAGAAGGSGILTPSTEGVLNAKNGLRRPEEKETRRDAMAHLLKTPFTVKPHPPNRQVAPRVLQPIMLLPREHLSLSHIDYIASGGEFGHSRLFEAHIRIMELESRLGAVPDLLIARSETKGTLYALERQRPGLYAVCRLGAWVLLGLGELAARATAVVEGVLNPSKGKQKEDAGDVGDAGDAITTPLLHLEQRKKRAAIEAIQSLVRKRARAASTSFEDLGRGSTLGDVATPPTESPQVKLEEPEPVLPVEEVLPKERGQAQDHGTQHTAEDVFENIRTHYFDALYKSMGSLAYFAKGPLSRARSAFHLDLDSNLDMNDLIDFLKGLILTTVQIDKKYRETVPNLLLKLKDRLDSSDEARKKKQQQRKSKKMKIGKNSLYPTEDESVQKWWAASKSQLLEDEAGVSDSQVKSHIFILRTRETQLQMILIMEILALEIFRGPADQGECGLPGDVDVPDQNQASLASQPKRRNKHNLPVLLDVHADRLTIWQSTASDEQILLEDSQSARISMEGTHEKKASSEPLKDFCIDVIVPFFSARLPELCDSINRKLGGPSITAPAPSKASKQSKARDQKPGSLTKRPISSLNPRRTLQRALSTDQQSRRSVSRGPSNAIALLRSATPSLISNVKRENADLQSLRKTHSCEDIRKTGHVGPRNGGLSLSSGMRDPKANRKAEVEAQLQEAISALRKPNRDVVGQAMVEADQCRSSSLAFKKLRKGTTKTSNVQVKATPVNNRFKDVMAPRNSSDNTSQGRTCDDNGLDLVPPSSVGPIPRSARARARPESILGETPDKRKSLADEVVGHTPIKQPSFVFERPRRDLHGDDTTRGPDTDSIGETPVKKPTQRLIFGEASASKPPGGEQVKKMDLYERLGWDDDFDDLA